VWLWLIAALYSPVEFDACRRGGHEASIMALATPSASLPGTYTAAPAEKGVAGDCHPAEWLTVADVVIDAIMHSCGRLSAVYNHTGVRESIKKLGVTLPGAPPPVADRDTTVGKPRRVPDSGS